MLPESYKREKILNQEKRINKAQYDFTEKFGSISEIDQLNKLKKEGASQETINEFLRYTRIVNLMHQEDEYYSKQESTRYLKGMFNTRGTEHSVLRGTIWELADKITNKPITFITFFEEEKDFFISDITEIPAAHKLRFAERPGDYITQLDLTPSDGFQEKVLNFVKQVSFQQVLSGRELTEEIMQNMQVLGTININNDSVNYYVTVRKHVQNGVNIKDYLQIYDSMPHRESCGLVEKILDLNIIGPQCISRINEVLPLFEALRENKVYPMVYGKLFFENKEFDLSLEKILDLLKNGKDIDTKHLYGGTNHMCVVLSNFNNFPEWKKPQVNEEKVDNKVIHWVEYEGKKAVIGNYNWTLINNKLTCLPEYLGRLPDFFELLKQDAENFKGVDLVEKIKAEQKALDEHFLSIESSNAIVTAPPTVIVSTSSTLVAEQIKR